MAAANQLNDREILEAKQAIEKNKQEAITLATEMYKVIIDKTNQMEPEEIYKFLRGKYPTFDKAYPVVLKAMAVDRLYHPIAFKKYLDKLEAGPITDAETFAQRSADYMKLLYIEISKSTNRRRDEKRAKQIWEDEYEGIMRNVREMKNKKIEAEEEYVRMGKDSIIARRKELLDFVTANKPTGLVHHDEMSDESSNSHLFDIQELVKSLNEKSVSDTPDTNNRADYTREELEKMTFTETMAIARRLTSYADELTDTLQNQNDRQSIIEMKEEALILAKKKLPKEKKPKVKYTLEQRRAMLVGTNIKI